VNALRWIAVGIDLAASETKNTGVAAISEHFEIDHAIVHTDSEIISYVEAKSPILVVIDAPLSLPKQRKSLDERSEHHLRQCDRELLRMGIKFFPITLGPMRQLTKRGMALAKVLREKGYNVFEGYPGGAQDILGIPRKSKGLHFLVQGLRRHHLNVGEWSADELDAVTCAYVGLLYTKNQARLIGDPSEGEMLLPMR
jgi:predicted nuclease with RNAse H fold